MIGRSDLGLVPPLFICAAARAGGLPYNIARRADVDVKPEATDLIIE
jgi:hypothetical protein